MNSGSNAYYWTMSPCSYGSFTQADIFYVHPNGTIYNTTNGWDTQLGLRPVINLKDNTVFTTKKEDNKGTASNPYIVQ